MQISGHVDDDTQMSALDVFYEMDGRQSRYIKEVLDWYRDERATDLRRSESNESADSMTCLNAVEEKNGKVGKVSKVRKVSKSTSRSTKNSWRKSR